MPRFTRNPRFRTISLKIAHHPFLIRWVWPVGINDDFPAGPYVYRRLTHKSIPPRQPERSLLHVPKSHPLAKKVLALASRQFPDRADDLRVIERRRILKILQLGPLYLKPFDKFKARQEAKRKECPT